MNTPKPEVELTKAEVVVELTEAEVVVELTEAKLLKIELDEMRPKVIDGEIEESIYEEKMEKYRQLTK